MFTHEPLVRHTIVAGLPVLSRIARDMRLIRLFWVSPTWR
jgi:hypothetical protein